MSTTVELVRANERYARLRAAVEELAAEWEGKAAEHVERAVSIGSDTNEGLLQVGTCGGRLASADDLRALLAAVDS